MIERPEVYHSCSINLMVETLRHSLAADQDLIQILPLGCLGLSIKLLSLTNDHVVFSLTQTKTYIAQYLFSHLTLLEIPSFERVMEDNPYFVDSAIRLVSELYADMSAETLKNLIMLLSCLVDKEENSEYRGPSIRNQLLKSPDLEAVVTLAKGSSLILKREASQLLESLGYTTNY